jgi:hypothetical protein
MKKKKKWVTPELIVLVRGTPQEAVLTSCKETTATPGPAHTQISPLIITTTCYTAVGPYQINCFDNSGS